MHSLSVTGCLSVRAGRVGEIGEAAGAQGYKGVRVGERQCDHTMPFEHECSVNAFLGPGNLMTLSTGQDTMLDDGISRALS